MKILILTSVYRDYSLGNKDSSSTNIVNSFAANWARQGHEVVVVHNCHKYPDLVHRMPRKIRKFVEMKLGFGISDISAVKKKVFMDDKVTVIRLPIRKYIPHQKPSDSVLKKQCDQIKTNLRKINFVPDVITGHWASPQMELISILKSEFECPNAVVLHGTGYVTDASFGVERFLPNIDKIGVRSKFQSLQMREDLKLDYQPFVCHSGVPDDYLKQYDLNTEKYQNIKTWKFAYVGRLVDYKNIDATIKALSKLEIDWELNIIGDGAAKFRLKELTKELQLEEHVHFTGRLSRDKVMEYLKDTHCFIMISTNEVFGLVYLEAMAASCITIASRNGGVDGIIEDGVNGYLCEQGNYLELGKILSSIAGEETKKLIKVVRNGYLTANEYSDSKVAQKYLLEISTKGEDKII